MQRDRDRSSLLGHLFAPRDVTRGCLAPSAPAPEAPGVSWLSSQQRCEIVAGPWQGSAGGRRNFDELICPRAVSDMPEMEKISHKALLHPWRES